MFPSVTCHIYIASSELDIPGKGYGIWDMMRKVSGAKRLETTGLMPSNDSTGRSGQLGAPLLPTEGGYLFCCCADIIAENGQTTAEVDFVPGATNSCHCLICWRFAQWCRAKPEFYVLCSSDVDAHPCRQQCHCEQALAKGSGRGLARILCLVHSACTQVSVVYVCNWCKTMCYVQCNVWVLKQA